MTISDSLQFNKQKVKFFILELQTIQRLRKAERLHNRKYM
jgi:hypothetical protein